MTEIFAVFEDGREQRCCAVKNVIDALAWIEGRKVSWEGHGTAVRFRLMPDRREVEALKNEWRSDPIWDIWNTEGFEHYEEELRAYQAECERRWTEEAQERLQVKARHLGCPGNLALAQYVLGLEARLKDLERKVFE